MSKLINKLGDIISKIIKVALQIIGGIIYLGVLSAASYLFYLMAK